MEKFTHKKIENLSSPAGTKTWFYRHKYNEKEKWLTLGNFPAMGVELNGQNLILINLFGLYQLRIQKQIF